MNNAAALLIAAELVGLEGGTVEVKLQAVNGEAVTFVGEAAITLPIKEVVRWGHPAEPRQQILVVLADGARLVTAAAWSGGAPLQLEDNQVVVLTDVWGGVRVPRSLVHGFVFAQRKHQRDREEFEALVRGEPSSNPSQKVTRDQAADLVLLTNKDHVKGQLTALTGGSLTLETEVGPVKLPLSRVEAVVLGRRGTGGSPAVQSQPPSLAVGTRDGSLVYANQVTAHENQLSIAAAGGIRLEGGSADDVVLLQSLGGPFVYLSDLEPDGYRHVPYLLIEWPYQGDQNVLGEPLSVGGKRYLKGIGMHSAARLTYRLSNQYRRFDAAIAIDDAAEGRGSVTFGVYVLRDGQWQEKFTSGIVRGGDAPQPISVDVRGANGLTLTVDYADRGDEMDRADWLDARLVK